jgi:hypothetical protein
MALPRNTKKRMVSFLAAEPLPPFPFLCPHKSFCLLIMAMPGRHPFPTGKLILPSPITFYQVLQSAGISLICVC